MQLAPIEELHNAAKEYRCTGCPDPILPGNRYVRCAVPPWMDGEGDVDDEGRNIWIPLPRSEASWHVWRFHLDCYYHEMGYDE